jgi:uncharacterized membrane protein SpoIIM required for sporulation
MNQQSFTDLNASRWRETELLVEMLEQGRGSSDAARLPALFRQLCSDMALAQHRMYGARLCADLNDLVIRCRDQLARPQARARGGFARLVVQDFPRAVRREWRLFWLGMLLFFGPMILMTVAAYLEPRWIFTVIGPEEMEMMDGMYGPGETDEFIRGEFGSDFGMFGFYIMNNVSIGLRCAGMGILAMVGSMFALGYQGVVLGAMTGYVHYAGNLERFNTFVVSHAAFELTGIVICGVAGMILGQAILKPGASSRGAALTVAGRRALPLIYGGVLLIFAAAFIEGFWSASAVPPQWKMAAGAGCALLLTFYFIFCGRGGEHEA